MCKLLTDQHLRRRCSRKPQTGIIKNEIVMIYNMV